MVRKLGRAAKTVHLCSVVAIASAEQIQMAGGWKKWATGLTNNLGSRVWAGEPDGGLIEPTHQCISCGSVHGLGLSQNGRWVLLGWVSWEKTSRVSTVGPAGTMWTLPPSFQKSHTVPVAGFNWSKDSQACPDEEDNLPLNRPQLP